LTAEPATPMEIEVYELEPAAPGEPSAFEKTLAARARERQAAAGGAGDVAAAPAVQEEVTEGLAIRRRRLSYRARRRRNVVIIVASVLVLSAVVAVTVRVAVARMPKYRYEAPAHAAATARALAFAAALEDVRVDPLAGYEGPTATLVVEGAAGKVIIDGAYVADAPTKALRLPVGRRHVVVKEGRKVIADEVITFAAGEDYKLEVAGAAALAAKRAF